MNTSSHRLVAAICIAMIFVLNCTSSFAGNYTWTGNTSSAWNTTSNWSPSGTPGANDTVNISDGSGNETVQLNSDVSINRLVITGREIDLNTRQLTISSKASLNGGSISNGTLIIRGTYAFFQGTNSNCTIDCIVNQIKFSGGIFDGKGSFEHNGSANGWGEGGCVFNDSVKIKSSGTSYLRMGQSTGDTFNGAVEFISTGTYPMQVAFHDTTIFKMPVRINCTSGGISFCNDTTVQAAVFQEEAFLLVGSTGITGGTITLKNIYQENTNAVNLTASGSTLITVVNSTFNGKLTITSPGVLSKYSTYNDSTSFARTSNTTSAYQWEGGNTFNGVFTLTSTNSSSGVVRMANKTGDRYNADAYFNTTSTAGMEIAYSDTSEFKGNIFINHSKVVFNKSKGVVRLTGNDDQVLQGNATFLIGKLKLNKDGGTITLNRAMTIDSLITFTTGIINTDSVITLKAATTCSGASNQSFVDGPVKKIGNTAFVFPVGDEGTYFPVGISAPSISTDSYLARYYFQPQIIGDSLDTNLSSLSLCNYWKLERINGTANVYVTLYWDSIGCGLFDTTGIKMAFWDGAKWKGVATIKTGNDQYGSVVSTSALGQYLFYALGYNNKPIPISAELKAGTLRSLPEDFFGFNGANTIERDDNNISNQTWNHLFTQTTPVLLGKPETMIRIPAGTLSNYVDWRTGWPIDERNLPSGWFYSQSIFKNLPADLSGNEYSDVRNNLQLFAARPIVCWNILTSNFNFEIASTYRLNEVNLPVRYIELGEEFYLNDESYKLGFPSVLTYTNKAKEWANEFRLKALPQTYNAFNSIKPKIAIVGSDYNENFPGRRKLWLENTIDQIDPSDAIDAITIHDYITNIFADGNNCSALQNSKLKRHLVTAFEEEDKIKDNSFAKIADANGGKFSSKPLEIWMTEYNMFDYENSYIGTWAHGLFNAIMTLKYLETPEITKVISHTMTSDAVFGNIFESNEAFDQVRCHGILPNGSSPRQWEFTALGNALNQIALAMRNSTSCQQIEFSSIVYPILSSSPQYPQLYGWLFNSPQGKQAIILNLGNPQDEYNVDITDVFNGISTSNLYFEQLSCYSIDHAILGNASAVIGLNELTTNAIGGVLQPIPSSGVVLLPGLTLTRISFKNNEILARLTDNEICAGSSTTIVVEPGASTAPIAVTPGVTINSTSNPNVYEITNTSSITTTTDFVIAPCNTCSTNLLSLRIHPDLNGLTISVTGGSPLPSGEYYTCSSSDPLTLTANFNPSTNTGSSNTLPISYIWTPDSGLTTSSNTVWSNQIEVQPDRTTNYTVYVTDGFCYKSLSQNIVVPVARVDLGEDVLICDNSSAKLFATSEHLPSGIGYTWKENGIVISNSSDHYFTTNLNATTMYEVTVTEPITGCTQSDQVIVNVVECCGDPQSEICIKPKGNKNRCTINDLIDQLNEVSAMFIISPGTGGTGWSVISLGTPTIKINGGLIQDGDDNNFECYGCNFEFGEKAYWKLQNKTKANFHGCTFTACTEKMWGGFIVDTEGSFYAPEIHLEDCEIKEAETGCYMARDAAYSFVNCNFEDCFTDISFYRYKHAIKSSKVSLGNSSIFNCNFTRSTSELLPPHNMEEKRTAIRLEEVENLVIGDISGDPAYQNDFTKSIFGIESYNASFEMYNNEFHEMISTLLKPSGTAVYSTSKSDFNDRVYQFGDVTNASGNFIEKCSVGMILIGEANINVNHCTFGNATDAQKRITNLCISISATGPKAVSLQDNYFYDINQGVRIYDFRRNATIEVRNNLFRNRYSQSAGSFVNGTGLLIQNPFPYTYAMKYAVDISGNDFGTASTGEEMRIGLQAYNIGKMNIQDNRMYFYQSVATDKFRGIWLQNCVEPMINSNTITNTTSFAGGAYLDITGIHLDNTTLPWLKCNTLTRLGYPVFIRGNTIQTRMEDNHLREYDHGIELDQAIIGAQQIQPNHGDGNDWDLNQTQSTDFRVGGTIPTINPIPWFYTGSKTPTNIEAPEPCQEITPGTPIVDHKQNEPNHLECPRSNPTRDEIAYFDRIYSLGGVIMDTLRYEYFEDEFRYINNSFAYRALKEYPQLIYQNNGDDIYFENYVRTLDESNLLLSDSIVKLFNSDMPEQAITLSNNLNPVNTHETNYKFVTSAYLQCNITQTGFSSSDSIKLDSIANLTVLEGGIATYMARSILNLEIEDEMYSGSRTFNNSNTNSNSDEFSISPNPAISVLKINTTRDISSSTILIRDVSGKVILKGLGLTSVPIDNIEAGIYLIEIIEHGVQLFRYKFIKL